MRLPAVLLSVLLPGIGPAAAIPPPPEQVAANCETPTYASDTLVCGNDSLRALDARLRDAWGALDFAAVVAPGAWVEGQQDWIRRRSLCAFNERHAECLRDAYLERIAVLDVLRLVASRPPRQGTATMCPEAPWSRTSVRIRAPATAALAIEDTGARVLAAATQVPPGSTWTPYVGFSAEGAEVRLVPTFGQAIVCSPVKPP